MATEHEMLPPAAQVEERNQFLAAVVDSSDDAIIGKTLDGTITIWNRGAERLYGYTAGEAIGKPVSILSPPDRRGEIGEILEKVRNGHGVTRLETIRLAKGGLPVEVCLTVSPVRNQDGVVVGASTIARDIGHRRRAERVVRESVEQFRTLFERSRDCVHLSDFEGNFLEANQATLNLLGYTRDEFRRLNLCSLLTPDQLPMALGILKEVAETGSQAQPAEFRVRRRDGAFVDLETSDAAIPFGAGRAVLGIARDVSERKAAEEALRESQERFRIMADGCPAPLWVCDARGAIQFVNRSWREHFGHGREADHTWRDLVRPDEAEDFVRTVERGLQEHTVFRGDLRLRAADGAWRWFSVHAEPRFSSTGEFLGYIGIDLEITERKQAEEALRSSEEQFRQLAEHVREVFWIQNAGSPDVTYVSPRFEQVWGRPCEELYRDRAAWLTSVEPKDRERILSAFDRLIEDGQVDAEHRIRTPAGELKWIRNRAFAVHDEAGRIVRFVGLAEEITDQKRFQEQLIRAREAADAANRAKSEFLANMSHEIRTPLNGVIGMTGLLLDTGLTAEQRQYAEIVRSSGESLLGVVNDILDFSRIEAGRLELDCVDFDLRTVLEASTELLSHLAKGKALEVKCLPDGDVPWQLRGDSGRLRQILLNLGGNAVKFTPKGKVTIRVCPGREDESSAEIRFSVEDDGIGIAADRQADIFSPFTQADGSTTRKYGGTGLGLAISKQLVELLGGEIGVESQPGRGSKFWFTAVFEKPLRKPGAECLEAHETAANRREATRRTGESRPRPARILVAEDNITNQQVAASILAKLGHRVDVVENGKEALKSLRHIPYDLVLMDCQMPEMDGFEAAKRIREPQSGMRNPRIPIVAVTAYAMNGDREMCLAAGMNDYIAKPVDPEALAATLQKWLPCELARFGSAMERSIPAPATPEVSVPVFDEAALMKRLMGDRALARTIVTGFLDDMPNHLAALKSHLEARDAGAAGRRAHSMKGAAACVSAIALHNHALEMEHAAAAGNLHAIAARLPELERRFQIAREAMQGMKNGM